MKKTFLASCCLIVLGTSYAMAQAYTGMMDSSSNKGPMDAATKSGAKPATPSAATVASTSKADPDMAKVPTALEALDPKPIETLSPSEARKQYSATDAVKVAVG